MLIFKVIIIKKTRVKPKVHVSNFGQITNKNIKRTSQKTKQLLILNINQQTPPR